MARKRRNSRFQPTTILTRQEYNDTLNQRMPTLVVETVPYHLMPRQVTGGLRVVLDEKKRRMSLNEGTHMRIPID